MREIPRAPLDKVDNVKETLSPKVDNVKETLSPKLLPVVPRTPRDKVDNKVRVLAGRLRPNFFWGPLFFLVPNLRQLGEDCCTKANALNFVTSVNFVNGGTGESLHRITLLLTTDLAALACSRALLAQLHVS